MKVLVIGKPTYDVILPTAQYIAEGSKIDVTEKITQGGGTALYVASLLSKWGCDVSFTGVIGSDPYGAKIKSQLESFKVNTKFIEVNYENATSTSYILINKANGSSTQIIDDNKEITLTKFKYDFIPDVLIMDGTDYTGSMAALNNFPHATSILFANKVGEVAYDLSKKCKYVIANTKFAEALTKQSLEMNRSKSLVDFMQRIKDLNKATYIIMLKEKGVLYVSDNQVKMIPAIDVELKVDDTHSGALFFGTFAYGIINNYGMDNSAKIANIAGGLSLSKLGSVNAMLDLSDILSVAGLREVKEEVKEEETSPASEHPALKQQEAPEVLE